MSYALYSPKLLVRDIENFSKENSIVTPKNDNKVILVLKRIAKTIAKIIQVNIELKQASKILRVSIERDSLVFEKSGHREKEDILIKWERLSKILNEHSKKMPNNYNFFTKGIVHKSLYMVDIVNNFTSDLHEELYPVTNQNHSQEYLQELAKKFEHFPKDIMDDLTSDQHLECV